MKSLRHGAAIAALLATLCLSSSTRAQSGTKGAASRPPVPHKESLQEAVTQADGITSDVVDHVWAATDHYWHHGDYYRIISLIRVCVEADPTFTDAYGDGAWLLWSLGDTDGADKLLRYGISRRPDLWDLEYEFGWHLFNTKRYAAALPYLKAAVTSKDADAVSWKMLAHCYDKLGNYAKSVETWKIVEKKFPNDPAAQHNLEEMEAKLQGHQSGGAAAPK